MPDIEVELRHAMAEETAPLRAAPDLVARVVRRSRRRRRNRLTLVGAVAAMVLAAGAVPVYVALSDGPQVVSIANMNTRIGDIRVTYMPEDFTDKGPLLINDGVGRFWKGGGGRNVYVEVVYGQRAESLESLTAVSWPTNEQLSDVRRVTDAGTAALEGRVMSNYGRLDRGMMRMWVVRPGVGIRIWASAPAAGEIQRIAEGIQPAGSPYADSLAGVEVSDPRLPGIGATRHETEFGWLETTRAWMARTGGYVTVSVYRGVSAERGPLPPQPLRPKRSAEPRTVTIAGVTGKLLTGAVAEQLVGVRGKVTRFVWSPQLGLTIAVTTVNVDASAGLPTLADLVRAVHVP